MTAHRMTVNAMNSTVRCGSEQTALEHKPTKVRRADDNRDEAWGKGFNAQLNGSSDAAMPGRRIEGRTNFVVNDRSIKTVQRRKDRRKMLRHPFWRSRAAVASNAEGLEIGELLKLRWCWWGEK